MNLEDIDTTHCIVVLNERKEERLQSINWRAKNKKDKDLLGKKIIDGITYFTTKISKQKPGKSCIEGFLLFRFWDKSIIPELIELGTFDIKIQALSMYGEYWQRTIRKVKIVSHTGQLSKNDRIIGESCTFKALSIKKWQSITADEYYGQKGVIP